MSAAIQHCEILFNQGRYTEAIAEIGNVLAQEPQHAYAMILLVQCYVKTEQPDKALQAATDLISQYPNDAMAHYVMAQAHLNNSHSKEALISIEQAIAIDPEEADLFVLRAQIQLIRHQPKKALDDAEHALSLEPDNVNAANVRNHTLVKLNRQDDAYQGIDETLSQDPNNSQTHAAKGWALMHAGQFKEAQPHFREALRLDPESQWAREGVMECLRTKSWFYSLLLRYYLWMSRLTPIVQFAIIGGGYLGIKTISGIKTENPMAIALIGIAVLLYMCFVLSSWIATPIMNFFLQLDSFGRLALTRKERTTANIVAGLAIPGMTLFLGGLGYNHLYGPDVGFNLLSFLAFYAGAMCVTFVLPLCRYLECEPGRHLSRYRMWVIGFAAYILIMSASLVTSAPTFQAMLQYYGYLVLAFCIFGNVSRD